MWLSGRARLLEFLNYLAKPANITKATPTEPPPLEQIDHKKPEIHMLKLMDASNNSAQGIGQVFHSLWLQSGLKAEEFFNCLQPMDGDLGTVQNCNCLRAQRTPNTYPQESLNNIVFQLGASHTLWNVASTIFTQHFGDPKVATDGGAWQFLEALGFPSEKVIQKEDYTLMINQMERVTESIIYYGLRVIMKVNCKPRTEEQVKLSTAKWNAIVEECYSTFCTRRARKAAEGLDCPWLYNTLLMLHDFSTVVEATMGSYLRYDIRTDFRNVTTSRYRITRYRYPVGGEIPLASNVTQGISPQKVTKRNAITRYPRYPWAHKPKRGCVTGNGNDNGQIIVTLSVIVTFRYRMEEVVLDGSGAPRNHQLLTVSPKTGSPLNRNSSTVPKEISQT
ncbi:hypothetical protein MJO28_007490 [Puccinia striiformis f. sp. tritici]|uniref:Uncharacterized protein n=1 Tax=Puccinia striiformis f. sp. tritici TaxID=168172 RepID=A0ACC0EEJ3_9BASI|nr:hypothetical protein MJO28_007490 [Puccinia striiformis f. sp. tritici]